MAFTPRPWWVQKGWWGRHSVCAESALSAASLVAGSIYYHDDAKLISKAPDMHGALRALVAEARAKGVELQSLPDAERVLALI